MPDPPSTQPEKPSFTYPPLYSFPPFWTLQPTLSTRTAQLRAWSALILSYCAHHRLFTLVPSEALQTPLFHNKTLKKRLTLGEAREVLDWMAGAEGDRRVEWMDGGSSGAKSREKCWVWWRGVEEWAGLVEAWVEETGQRGVVLTVYELLEGEGTAGQEFHEMDPDVLQKALGVLVKRGKAQVFGTEGQEGVKFF
ncbi:hypothetical protein MMC19_000954 [Ptychographa xylographoides]|nr:hypothetical protein [Ptychographa xylographoides]